MGTLQKGTKVSNAGPVEALELHSRHWGSFVVVAMPTGQTRVLSTSTRSGCASTPLQTVKEKKNNMFSAVQKSWLQDLQGWRSFAGLACWRRSAFSREVWRYSCLGMSVFSTWTWEIAAPSEIWRQYPWSQLSNPFCCPKLLFLQLSHLVGCPPGIISLSLGQARTFELRRNWPQAGDQLITAMWV